MRAASRALAPPPTGPMGPLVRYRQTAPEYDHTQDSRNYIFDEQKALMAQMYTGQENAAGADRAQTAAIASYADERVPTIAPQVIAKSVSAGPMAEEYYFCFDSYNQGIDRITPDSGRTITFPFTAITGQPTLDELAAMSIESFYLPTLNAPAGSPQYFFDRRIMMYITSFSGNQYIYSADSLNYHFVFEIDATNSQSTHIVPINPTYVFRQKPSIMTELTVQFSIGAPPRLLRMPYDIVRVAIVNGSNPGQIRIYSDQSADLIIGGFVQLNSIIYPYQLGTQSSGGGPFVPVPVAVVISATESSAVIPDVTLKNRLLAPDGIFLSHITSPDTVQISGMDFSSLTGDTNTYSFNMFIRKNRIVFGMRFTSTRLNSNATLSRTYA